MSKELEQFIRTELQGNLSVLIDPKKKDSFSDNRINTWTSLVTERILLHLESHSNIKTKQKQKL
jgi:hypothetical protein|tara:strand:- start:247 stop:438 length:192 start_codon:yes stop_codon:yes gene_type:complete